nr:hypothetical protein [uncultured Pseudomonas sp.]
MAERLAILAPSHWPYPFFYVRPRGLRYLTSFPRSKARPTSVPVNPLAVTFPLLHRSLVTIFTVTFEEPETALNQWFEKKYR